MPKGQGGTGKDIANVMGVASGPASVIPGIGPILGAGLGLGSQVLSWILGQDKFDWNEWKNKQKSGINANYDTSLTRATGQAQRTMNATIGETTNAQGMASGVAGMSGTGRINAQTYSNIAQNRDQAVTGITNALEQNRASMLSAVEREAAQGSQEEDFNAPNAMTYIDNFTKSLQTPMMQEGIGGIIGGLGKGANWFGNLFKSGAQNTNSPNTTTSPVLNTNKGINDFSATIPNEYNLSSDPWRFKQETFQGFDATGKSAWNQGNNIMNQYGNVNLSNLNSNPLNIPSYSLYKKKRR